MRYEDLMNVAPKIGEQVKTRKVEIDAMFLRFLPERDCLMFQHKANETELVKLLSALREVKITFDVEIPERKVEITESMIDELRERFQKECPNLWPKDSVKNRLLTFDEFLIRELFGSGES